ncbi:hypothetical protein ACFC6U_09660 [Kitasatospora purpeofusca]|uniref:hypothetical protein n=1 Tax=Kitasatospora purpeofusca TaxID=67352 RepID=UPI0035D57AAE
MRTTIATWPLDAPPPPDVPAEFRTPCTRVGRDLRHLPAGARLPDGACWELSEEPGSGFLLGLGSTRGLRYTLEVDPYLPPGPLTALVAEQVQDHVTGYEFLQWPTCPGHVHLLVPAADPDDAERARWHCRRSGRPLALIGDLSAGS